MAEACWALTLAELEHCDLVRWSISHRPWSLMMSLCEARPWHLAEPEWQPRCELGVLTSFQVLVTQV